MPGAFAKAFFFGIYGIDAYQTAIDVDVTICQNEQVFFQIVGLPEGAAFNVPLAMNVICDPLCQDFSTVRQRDGANYGRRSIIHAKRRYLYQKLRTFNNALNAQDGPKASRPVLWHVEV